jgi:hypothetical protein
MSNYDKYDPYSGGSRAALAADFGYTAGKPDRAHADLRKLFAVALNGSGLLVKYGVGALNFVGVLVLTTPKAAGDTVDYMTAGDITDVLDAEINGTLTAGSPVYAAPGGTGVTIGIPAVTSAVGAYYIGRIHELNAVSGRARLVVRTSFTPMAA